MKKCEKCGKTFSDDTKFCDVCGAELVEVAEAEAAPAETAAPVDEEKKTVDVAGEAKKLAGGLAEKWNALTKQTKIIVGAVCAVVVLAIICIICNANKTTAFEVLNKASIEIESEEDKLYVYNGFGKKKEISTSWKSFSVAASSADGTTCVIRDDEKELYLLTIKGLVNIDDDVRYSWVSSKGETVAYLKDVKNSLGDLYLYTVKTKKSVKVDSDVVYDSVVLSPDGKTVAYSTRDDNDSDNYKALYSKGGKDPVVIAKASAPVAIANGGKFVYYIKNSDSGEQNLYLLKGKDSQKIVSNAVGKDFYFNKDLSEVIFSSDGKTYVSTKGKEAVKLNGNSIDAVLTGVTNPESFYTGCEIADALVLNIKSFKGSTILCGNTYYYVKSFSNVIKIVDASSVSALKFSADQNSLVYMKNHKLYKIANIRKPDSKKELGDLEDYSITSFVASADLKTFYFRADGDLYTKKGSSKPKKIASDATLLGMDYTNGGVYYFVDYDASEPNKLYYSVNGSKGKVIFKDTFAFNYADGRYAIVTRENKKDDDKLDCFVLNGKSTKKLFTIEK